MLEQKIVDLLKEKNMKVSFAESCTGGLLAATLINASGASKVLDESYVTYSEDAKQKILGVKKSTLDEFTVYSKEVALEMAEGLKKISNADFCVSVTGIAESNEACGYHFAIITPNKKIVKEAFETGTRASVRTKQTIHILEELLAQISQF